MLHDSVMYIINGVAFERLFGRIDSELSEVEATLDRITRYIPIRNADEFVAACSQQFQMRSKIRSIASTAYLKNVTISEIRTAVSEFGLDIEIDNNELIFDGHPRRRWEILKLLDDDYLGSAMTGLKYETNSKVGRG